MLFIVSLYVHFQVLKAHPEAQRVHLGCDEVYQLGKGQSAAYIASHKSTPQKLFLGHVVKVAKHLKTAISKVKPLIWDDWLRGIPYDVLAVRAGLFYRLWKTYSSIDKQQFNKNIWGCIVLWVKRMH